MTQANAINPEGAITGIYQPGLHGFLRAKDGTFTTFDPPGATFTWRVVGITPAGTIAGSYLIPDVDGRCCLERGFLRTR